MLKLFGKNAVVYSIGTVALRASAFLLIPIYTNFLSLEEYGLLATLLLTIHFMITLVDLGVRSGLMRFVSEYKTGNKLKYLIGSLVVINLTSGIFVTAVSFFFLKPLFVSVLHTEDVTGYLIFTCIAAVVQSVSLNVTSYYRAMNQGRKFMIRNLTVAAILILANLVLFIIFDAGIYGALLAYIISYGIVGLIVAVSVFAKTGFGISLPVLSRMFRYCAPLVFATGGFSVMETTAAYFLSYFTSLEQVGIYNLGYRLAQIGSMVIVLPFQLAYEPFLFANLDKPNIKEIVSKLTTYMFLAFTIVAVSISFVFRDLILLISPPEYFPAYYIIFLLMPGMAFSGLFYVAQSLIHVKGKTHITGFAVALFSISSVVMNYFLIQIWGMAGLLLVYNLVWISMALVLMKLGLKQFPVALEKKRLSVIAFTFVLFLSLIYMLHDSSSYLFYSIIPLLFLITIYSYYNGGFFDSREKFIIKDLLNKIISRFHLLRSSTNLNSQQNT